MFDNVLGLAVFSNFGYSIRKLLNTNRWLVYKEYALAWANYWRFLVYQKVW